MNRIYQIAGHRFEVSGERLCEAVDRMEGFRPFEVESGEGSFFFREGELTDVPAQVAAQYIFEYEDVTGTFMRTADGYRLSLKPAEEESFEMWCRQGGNEVWLCGNWSVRL